MKKEDLRIGDVVQLNCGGPNMVIVSINENYNEIECGWYNYVTGNFQLHYFSSVILTLINIK